MALIEPQYINICYAKYYASVSYVLKYSALTVASARHREMRTFYILTVLRNNFSILQQPTHFRRLGRKTLLNSHSSWWSFSDLYSSVFKAMNITIRAISPAVE